MSTPFFDAEQLIRLNRVSAYAVSPCGTWAAVAVARLDSDGGKYVSDLWRVPVAGGPATPLTRGDSDDTAPCFRRDGALGFLSNRRLGDKPGDRKQVWLLHPTGGDPAPLTDEALGVSAFRFAQSAPVLVCVANVLPGVDATQQRDEADLRKRRGPTLLRYRRSPVRFWDHWLPEEAPHLIGYADAGTGRRDLTPDATREFQIELGFAVDPHGRFVIATSAHPADDRNDDVDLVRIPLTGGDTVRALGAHNAVHAAPVLSPDGRWLAATRNVRSPNAHGPVTLVLTDTETGHARQLTGLERWLTPQCFSADGRALYAVCDDQGHTPVFRVDLETGELSRVSSTASGAHYAAVAMIPGSDRLAALRDHFFSPPELVAVGTTPESEPVVLTALSGFDDQGAREHVAITSQTLVVDGRAVQSWFAAPAASTTPGPGLVWVHGGPHSQWTDAWHWRWNVLAAVARGYTVALPNPAGSTGFGQALVEDVFGNRWGGQCYRDVMAATDALAAMPGVSPDRLALMGGSFGGYMASWVGTQTTRFAALVTHAGLFDLSVFGGTTDGPAGFMNDLGGLDADRDRERVELYSPRRFLDAWRTPVLILHGERDYRVPISEALVMFDALERRGVDVELGVFPDENHWILRPRNTVAWYELAFEFLGRHTGAPPITG